MLDRLVVLLQCLIETGRQQAQLTGFIIRMATLVECMVHKGQLTQNQKNHQKRGSEFVFRRIHAYWMQLMPEDKSDRSLREVSTRPY